MTAVQAQYSDFPLLRRSLQRVGTILPALVVAYPLLVWPLVYAVPVVDATTGLAVAPTAVGDYLLNKLYFPPLFMVAVLNFFCNRQLVTGSMRVFVASLGLLLAFCLLSALWSLAPDITVRRAVLEIIICATLVLAVMSTPRPIELLTPVFWLMMVVVAVNLAVVLSRAAGPIGHEGIYSHKNSLGGSAGLAIVVCLYFLSCGSKAWRAAAVLTIAASFFLLDQSRSKTAMALAILSPVIALYFYFVCGICRIPLLIAIVTSIAAAILGILVAGAIMDWNIDDVSLWLFNDKTFTGRTFIWQFTIERIQERPWLGYGYSAFWDIGPQSPKFKAPNFIALMAHAHNGYLGFMLETGIVGFLMLVVFLGVAMNCIGRTVELRPSFFIFGTSLASYGLLANLMEADLLVPMSQTTMLLPLVSGAAAAFQHNPPRLGAYSPIGGPRERIGR